jgi:hypothetical protein
VARTLEVEELRISRRTADKLWNEHDLHPDQVRAAVEGVGRLPFRWHHHPKRGLRAMILTAIEDQAVLVVLYPAIGEAGTVWNLGSAYPV